MEFIKIIFIDNSIENCRHIETLFSKYENIIFDYESDYDNIAHIDFDYYDICFYSVNTSNNFDFLKENSDTIFVACDNVYSFPENEKYIKEIMNSGFDMYVYNIMDMDTIKHIMSIYKLIMNQF